MMPKQERFRFQADISLPSTRQPWGIFDVRVGGGYVLTEHPYGKAGSGDTSLPGTYGTFSMQADTIRNGCCWNTVESGDSHQRWWLRIGRLRLNFANPRPQSLFISLLGHTVLCKFSVRVLHARRLSSPHMPAALGVRYPAIGLAPKPSTLDRYRKIRAALVSFLPSRTPFTHCPLCNYAYHQLPLDIIYVRATALDKSLN